MRKDYTHELNHEVRSISGGYCLDEEKIVEIRGRKVLYALGNAVADSACCGFYGCRFALVPGYVVRWKYRMNRDGLPISEVEPIDDEGARRDLTTHMKSETGVTQVQFW